MKKIDLGNDSFFIGEDLKIGQNFKIGKNNIIRALNLEIGDNVTIGSDNNFLIGKKIQIGNCTFVGSFNDFTGITVKIGEYVYLDSNVIIGHGGKMNYDSHLKVGNKTMICSYVKLNLNFSIDIGNNVGIGENVDIWTHGSYPPVLDGFPAQFGKVIIGDNVWLPAKSTVMPGVKIGNDIVIGANSVVNKDLPSGSLCAGIPVKVLRENFYPKILNQKEKSVIILDALSEYEKLVAFKNLEFTYQFDSEKLVLNTKNVHFNFNSMIASGELSDVEEDFRDFLRRRGIKFFTGKLFKSITPPIYKDLLAFKI